MTQVLPADAQSILIYSLDQNHERAHRCHSRNKRGRAIKSVACFSTQISTSTSNPLGDCGHRTKQVRPMRKVGVCAQARVTHDAKLVDPTEFSEVLP